MSDAKMASIPQPPPKRNNNPSCHDLVIKDMIERKEFGLNKYGTILQPGNGRAFLVDAYQEVLDMAVYLRGAIYEQDVLEELLIAAYKRGWRSCEENEGDDRFLDKAARDYADKAMHSPKEEAA